MPNIKSAKKRVKVIATKSANNQAVKSNLKTVIKKAEVALANSSDNKEETVMTAVKTLDKAAGAGIIHKNAAARKKSQLVKKLNA